MYRLGILLIRILPVSAKGSGGSGGDRRMHTVKGVLEDGMQWEQSPMYHNEVYHCFLTAYWYGQRAGLKMPDTVREAVRKMAYVNYKWKKPDHTQFTQGDSDATDLRDQITAGAYVLNDSVLKSGGYEILDYDSVWRFGWKACRDYADMEAQAPDFVSVQLPFGGNYYFRSGWSEKASLLHFHCGETGGGHGHADKLHVDLVIRGEDVLYESLLHFDGHGRAERWKGNNDCEGIRFTGKDMEAYVQFRDHAEAELIDTEQSSYYNEKHPNQTYIRKTKAEGFCREIMVINGGEKGKSIPASVEKIPLYSEVNGKYLPQEQAEGLRITLGDREYILFLCHGKS